jgi:hypothetical protein
MEMKMEWVRLGPYLSQSQSPTLLRMTQSKSQTIGTQKLLWVLNFSQKTIVPGIKTTCKLIEISQMILPDR